MRFIFGLLSCWLLVGCSIGQKMGPASISWGTVQYDIRIEAEAAQQAMLEQNFGNRATLYFNQQIARLEKHNQTPGQEFFITDLNTGLGQNYLEVMGNKYALTLTREMAPSIDNIRYTDQSREIAGYRCKQALATMNEEEIEIWYTQQIGVSYLPYTPALKGFALAYTLAMPFGKIIYTAVEVDPTPPPAEKLQPPEGYREMTIMELQRELMEDSEELIPDELPNFSLPDLHGDTVDLDQLKGQVIVLNFWFIACQPCIMEMPELNELKAEYKDKEVVFLAITFDEKEDVHRFLEKQAFDFRILPDARSVISEYGIMAFPTTIVLDKEGTLIDRFSGGSFNIKAIIKSMIEAGLKS